MVPMGVPVGWGHLVHPQGAGHSALKGPGHGACLASSFSLSFLSFFPCFSSSPAVKKKSHIATDSLGLINLVRLYNVLYTHRAPFSSFLGQKIHGYLPA